jgi:hypothetical protein
VFAADPGLLPSAPTSSFPPKDEEAQAVAHAFARAYLTADDKLVRRLAPSLAGHLGEMGAARPVNWSTVVRTEPTRDGTRVLVLAETRGGLVSLAVPVSREAGGGVVVRDLPAIVGQRAGSSDSALPAGDRTDTSATATVTRALRSYLTGDGNALSADLLPGADVVLPDDPLVVRDVNDVTWVTADREVRALASARSQGGPMQLAYRVGVARQAGRWFVTWIGTQQASGGRSR